MKKAAHTGGAYTTLGQLVPKSLYKSVQVIEIIIVEDVLVLVYKLSQRFRRFVYIVVVLCQISRYNLLQIAGFTIWWGIVFMNTNHTLKEYSFHFFLTSVLRQIASSCNQEIFFDAQIPSDFFNLKIGGKPSFDAIAPNGFDDINGPVIFEFKFYNQEIKYNRLLSILNSLYKRVMQLTFADVTLILVTNSYIDSTIDLSKDISKKIPYKSNVDLKIWDQHKIEQLASLYPIDFSNAQNIDICVHGPFRVKFWFT